MLQAFRLGPQLLAGSGGMRVRRFLVQRSSVLLQQPRGTLPPGVSVPLGLRYGTSSSHVRSPRLSVVEVRASASGSRGGPAGRPSARQQAPPKPAVTFESVGLSKPLQAAMESMGISEPTEIQVGRGAGRRLLGA